MPKHIIGLDIGGTKISGVVFDGHKVAHELTIVTPKNLFEFKRNLLKLVSFLSAKEKIFGLGAGAAGLVDIKKGTVSYSPNIKFINNLDLVGLLKSSGIKNVKIDNDASCFARAELVLGQGRQFTDFIALTLGTGIGGGIVINKKLFRGKNNFGAELGHVVAEGAFFEKLFQKARDSKNFQEAGRLIGESAASFINVFASEAVIIGGGFGQNESKKYLPALKTTMDKFLFNKQANVKILITKLNNAGALGAALLVK